MSAMFALFRGAGVRAFSYRCFLFLILLCFLLCPDASAQTVFRHTFGAGWHLVAPPVAPEEGEPLTIQNEESEPLDLYAYQQGKVFSEDDPGFPEVKTGVANWLLLSETTEIRCTGYAVNPQLNEYNLLLYKGWNVIATPWLTPIDWDDSRVRFTFGDANRYPLSHAIGEGWTDGKLYDLQSDTGDYEVLTPNFNPAREMAPWKGYLLYVESDIYISFAPPSSQPGPLTVELTAPENEQDIFGPVAVTGTVSGEGLLQYELAYAVAGTTDYMEFASGSSVVNDATLGTFNPTMLMNGAYTIRLSAMDTAGRNYTRTARVFLKGARKVGLYTLTFVDLEVPLPGISIRVTRTYDSRDKRTGDFGVGWNSDFSDVKLEESGILGEGWVMTGEGGFSGYCIAPTKDHIVTVTMPGGEIHQFDGQPEQPCQSFTPPGSAKMIFAPMGTTTGSLSIVNNPTLDVIDAGVAVELWYPQAPFDPDLYQFTTPDGAVLVIDDDVGLHSMTDIAGNTLTIERDGIEHSSGRQIGFERDSLGRITDILDPEGRTIHYEYDGNGDLVRQTDPLGNVTEFVYDDKHNLTDIKDPLGRTAVRNEYDDQGRLIVSIDAKGNRTEYTHDDDNRQLVTKDPLGHISRHVYDERGNILSEQHTVTIDETTQVLAVKSYQFDAEDRVLSETDADGVETTYDYEGDYPSEVAVDPGGLNLVTSNAYEEGNLVSSSDPEGHTISFDYADGGCCNGKITEITDFGGNSTEIEYNEQGKAVRQTDPMGSYTIRDYDANGNVILFERYLSDDTLFSRQEYSYDAYGNKTTDTVYRTIEGTLTPLTTYYGYDLAGNVVAVTDPVGRVTRHEYNAVGKETAKIDPVGRRTEYEFDEVGDHVKTTYPDSTFESYEYDARHNLISETDREGRTISYVYDELGRKIKTIHPDGSVTKTVFSPGGRIIAEVDARGNRVEYEYDSAGRRTKIIEPAVYDALKDEVVRPTTQVEYDRSGRKTALIDANGNRIEYEYNNAGLLWITKYPDGATTERRYDGLNRLSEKVDPEGNVTTFTYDPAGNLLSVMQPSPAEGEPRPVTSFTYDETGLLLTQTNANGRMTSIEYDRAGRSVLRRLPLGMESSIAYDLANNPVAATDYNGELIAYEYDPDTLLPTRKTWADASEFSFTYTPGGDPQTIVDERGTTTYVYNADGELSGIRSPDRTTVAYAYDEEGNRTALIANSSLSAAYEYDALNRLSKVTDAQGGETTFQYDSVGNLIRKIYPNGNVTEYTYDTRYRLTRVANKKQNGDLISSYDYIVSPAGNRTRVVEHTGRTVDYVYDNLYRLIEERISDPSSGDTTIAYTYDAVGNRLTKTESGVLTEYTYDHNDRLTVETRTVTVGALYPHGQTPVSGGVGSLMGTRSLLLSLLGLYGLGAVVFCLVVRLPERGRFGLFQPGFVRLVCLLMLPGLMVTYDMLVAVHAEAQVEKRLAQLGETLTYEYDNNGNMTSVTDGTLTNTYEYDQENRLVSADVEFGAEVGQIEYGYDTEGIRVSKTVGGETTYYQVDKNRPYAQVIMEYTDTEMLARYVYGEDLISMSRPSSGTSYYLFDGQMSTRQLTDSAGEVTDTYTYDAFGVGLDKTGTTENNYLYTGQQFDPHVGLIYLRARYYNPANGRFITADPYGGDNQDPFSLHKYLYADDNPVNKWDPSGKAGTLIEMMVTLAIQNIMFLIEVVNKVRAYCQATLFIKAAGFVLLFLMFLGHFWNADPSIGYDITLKNYTATDGWDLEKINFRFQGYGKKSDMIIRFQFTLKNGIKIILDINIVDPYKSKLQLGYNWKFLWVKVCLIEVLKVEFTLRLIAVSGIIFAPINDDTLSQLSKYKFVTFGLTATILDHIKIGIELASIGGEGLKFGHKPAPAGS